MSLEKRVCRNPGAKAFSKASRGLCPRPRTERLWRYEIKTRVPLQKPGNEVRRPRSRAGFHRLGAPPPRWPGQQMLRCASFRAAATLCLGVRVAVSVTTHSCHHLLPVENSLAHYIRARKRTVRAANGLARNIHSWRAGAGTAASTCRIHLHAAGCVLPANQLCSVPFSCATATFYKQRIALKLRSAPPAPAASSAHCTAPAAPAAPSPCPASRVVAT